MKKREIKLLIKTIKWKWINACQKVLDYYNGVPNEVQAICPFCVIVDSYKFDADCEYCIWNFFTGASCEIYAEKNIKISKRGYFSFSAYLKYTKNKHWVALRKKQLPKWIEKLKKL